MKPDVFATSGMRPGEQYEAWRSWFMPLLDVRPLDADDPGFRAENRVWKLEGMAVSCVRGPAVRVVRSPVNLRRDPIDHWVITYCRAGHTFIRTHQGDLRGRPSVPFVWSLGDISDCERSTVDRVQLLIARDAFPGLAPLLDAACGRELDSPLGLLLGDFMQAMEHRLPDLEQAEVAALSRAAAAIVAAACAPTRDRAAEAGAAIAVGRLERVRQAVRANLHLPMLGPEALCRMTGLSRSNLYRLMQGSGGVARYVQRQRLLAALRQLEDPANRLAIGTIAGRLCFADASSFSRAFRREFGICPRAARGVEPGARQGRLGVPEPSEFSELLRGAA